MADPFQTSAQIKPDQIIDILLRGKWILIIPLCISLTVGIAMTLTANKTYQAATMILVQPQRVPTNYVRSVVSSTISQRISTISQQILSRSNIEKIIDQFGLYEDKGSMYLEDKIEGMRKRIKVRIERARTRGGAEAFSISFTGSQPQRVMRIANTLASYFMDENLKVREAQAVGTSNFLDAELEKTRKRLEQREQKLAAYRTKYLGGLPDELETNLRTLDRLQIQMTDKGIMLRDAKKVLGIINTRIADSKKIAAQDSGRANKEDGAGDTSSPDESENKQKLIAAQLQYENLLLRYTKRHPDVLKFKKIIEKLEKVVEEEALAANDTKAGTAQGTPQLPANTQNKAELLIERQHSQLVYEIKIIQSDLADIQKKMKLYQQRVEDTPKRELELQSLKRDYTNIQDIFNSLLDRKLEAELSVNMEKKQKGEQFRILDHARMPEKPISPNVTMLFLMSVAAGLGLGGGIIFLRELTNLSVIRRDEQIEGTLGLNILASIPPLEKPSARLQYKIRWVVFTGCCLYACIFLGFFAILHYKGLDRTINFIKTLINV